MVEYQRYQINNFYAARNTQIKKQMRLRDMNISYSTVNVKRLNFFVLGARNSGKKCLLRTLNFAMNGNKNCNISNVKLCNVLCQKYQIKGSKISKFTGLTVLKQSDEKLSINGYIIKQQNISQSQISNFIEGLDSNYRQINLFVVCLSTIKSLQPKQKQYIVSIVQKLKQLNKRYMIVGTKIDHILQQQLNNSIQIQKNMMVQTWRYYIQNTLKINKADIYCIQNYKMARYIANQNHKMAIYIANSEQINYYALSLLKILFTKVQYQQPQKHLFNFECFKLF